MLLDNFGNLGENQLLVPLPACSFFLSPARSGTSILSSWLQIAMWRFWCKSLALLLSLHFLPLCSAEWFSSCRLSCLQIPLLAKPRVFLVAVFSNCYASFSASPAALRRCRSRFHVASSLPFFFCWIMKRNFPSLMKMAVKACARCLSWSCGLNLNKLTNYLVKFAKVVFI